MPEQESCGCGEHDDRWRRLTEQIAKQVDEQLSRRMRRPGERPPRPAPLRGTDSAYHGNRVHYYVQRSTVFNGDVQAGTSNTGPSSVDAHMVEVRRALRTVLERLPEAGLGSRAERAVRKQAGRALRECEGVQPQRSVLRRLVGQVSTALVTSTASGGANPVAAELVKHLQHVQF
ncbi:hypothetical protein [Parasphingorhabdus pacifica]